MNVGWLNKFSDSPLSTFALLCNPDLNDLDCLCSNFGEI